MKTVSLDLFELDILIDEVIAELKDQWRIEGNSVRNTAKFVGSADRAMFLITLVVKLQSLQSQLNSEYIFCKDYTRDFCDFNINLSLNDAETPTFKQVVCKLKQKFSYCRYSSFGEFIQRLYEKLADPCEIRRRKLTLVH